MAIEANLKLVDVGSSWAASEVILPSQHFTPPGRQEPEQRLMMAILHDAFECVDKYRHATSAQGRRLFREATRWFFADEAQWPFSFESICGVLDLDANAVRQRLRVLP